jgi:ABC-type sugar transport system ATPase subunit
MEEGKPLLEMKGISKNFGAVQALRDVDFQVSRGEIVGLVGDNGAGKSTLIKIITGAYPHDGGEITFDGQKVSTLTPKFARQLGIETIYQDLAIHPNIDVRGNIFMGREPVKHWVMMDQKRMESESWRILEKLKIHFNSVRLMVGSLSGGQRQAVAISRALYWEAKLVIMDEPTAALAVPETKKVLELIRALKANHVAVIFICHNLQQILSTVDRIVVLRRGELAGDCLPENACVEDIVKMMVGEVYGGRSKEA